MKKALKTKPIKKQEPLKLNLGCGNSKMEGFTGIDISDKVGADIVHNLTQYPWPIEDNSVEEIHCSHFFEHLDGIERMAFMNECYRIMRHPYEDADGNIVKSKMVVITPAPFTHRYMQDPTHKFPMVVQETYTYFNKKGREEMGVSHYPITCDFDWSGIFQDDPNVLGGRNDEYKHFMGRHNINTLIDLHIKLEKI